MTFNMVHLEETSITSGGRKRMPSVGNRLTSKQEISFTKLFRQTSVKKSRARMASIFSKRKKAKEVSSTLFHTLALPGSSNTLPTSSASVSPTASKGTFSNSIGKLARMIVKPRRRSSVSSMPPSPLARAPSPGTCSMASPTSNSPPLPRASSPLVPLHSGVSSAIAQARIPLRKTMSASGVASSDSASQHRHAASTLLDVPGKNAGSPLLRRTLSPDHGSSPESSPSHSSGSGSSLDNVSPLMAASWGSQPSTPKSSAGPKPKKALRRASTLSPSHSRPTHKRKISWQERAETYENL